MHNATSPKKLTILPQKKPKQIFCSVVRGHRLRRPQEEETSAPWSKRGLPSWLGLDRTLQCYGSLSTHL